MSACCPGAPDTQSSSLTGQGWLASAGTLRRLLRHFYRGVRCGGVVVSQQFIGQVPDWIDPETTGVPFERAPDHFGARPLFEFVSTYFPSRINDIGTLSFSDVLTRKPQEVQSKWWTWRDVEMPFLLRALISGNIRAFGALDRADASTVWIPPRLWKDLQPDLDNKRCFSGAGATYWNVRVVSTAEFVAMDEGLDNQMQEAHAATIKRAAPSFAQLTAWYKSRVSEHKSRREVPPFTSDLEAAKAEFGREDRTRLKQLRRDHAPADWNVGTPGRKKNAQ